MPSRLLAFSPLTRSLPVAALLLRLPRRPTLLQGAGARVAAAAAPTATPLLWRPRYLVLRRFPRRPLAPTPGPASSRHGPWLGVPPAPACSGRGQVLRPNRRCTLPHPRRWRTHSPTVPLAPSRLVTVHRPSTTSRRLGRPRLRRPHGTWHLCKLPSTLPTQAPLRPARHNRSGTSTPGLHLTCLPRRGGDPPL